MGSFRTLLLSPPPLPAGFFLGRRFLGHRFLGHCFLGRRFLGHRFLGRRFLGRRFPGHRFLVRRSSFSRSSFSRHPTLASETTAQDVRMSKPEGAATHNCPLERQIIRICKGIYSKINKSVKMYINSH